ncbi:aminoacyl-tRNA hydrolase [Limnobacter litoralis]|uniref:Peptidyl-tRNA hydrolase n=2 Tax=Limnobacter TaxID=131079 RepID=A0ABQ5YTN1_9BURK|nr:aminoacyl-tRNA hydrolase [Limnobacter litoralis]GLR27402.1 peptidyl-tRNA hydrolase [Limnobacter litoralis]
MPAQKPIRLIVGLCNPGPEYVDTRHNAGAWYTEALAQDLGAQFKHESRFFGDLARVKVQGEDLWILMPTTYMNRSGQAVLAVASFFKILPDEILVAHDELDVLPGQLKIKKGGGNAGHNGLKDISAKLGTPDFWRARIGIGHPRSLGLNQGVADFVLHRPSADHQNQIADCIEILLKNTPLMLQGNIAMATTRVHTEVDKAWKARQTPAKGEAGNAA